MDSKVEACAECTRSCMSLHKAKLDPYPIVCSFFKVMFGNQFGEELIVPPRFARTLKSLEGKNTYLEDTTGQKWDVKLSKVKGSLVIKHGWQEFSLDHGIELGDFVVFHYIRGSHFIAQIFTRSGCERAALFCEKDYQNKRCKAIEDSVARGGLDGTSNTEFLPKVCSDSRMVTVLDVDSVQRQDNVTKSLVLAEVCLIEGSTRKRPRVTPAEDFLVEPYFMTSRNTSFSREDDRDYLFDLSAFEMPAKKMHTDDEGDRDYLFDLSAFEMPAKKVHTDETSLTEVKRWSQGFNQLQNAQIRTASVDVEEWQITETSPLLVSNEVCLSREEPNLLLKSSSDIDMPSDSDMPRRAATPIASQFSTAETYSQPLGATARIVKKEQPCQNYSGYWVAHNSRSVHRVSFKEPAMNNEGNFNDKVATDEGFLKKMVKPEPVDFCDSTLALMINITCSVEHDSEPFLELPECLPIKISRQATKMNQKLIVLRDPVGKRWPVIYQERKGVKILANGWKEFRKYNNIQPGDKCTFVLENSEECIFKVEILRS